MEKLAKTKEQAGIADNASFETHNADMNFIEKINKKVIFILRLKDSEHLNSALSFVIKELVDNANKANLKRAFFKKSGFSISTPEQYKNGMEKFSTVIKQDVDSIIPYLADLGLKVKVVFREYQDDTFDFVVMNNVKVTDEEKRRVREKIDYFKELSKDQSKCFELFDETEGAGMGLFLSLQLLEKFGISAKAFNFGVYKNMTVSRITFKWKKVLPPPDTIIVKEILKVVKSLPKFPVNVNKALQELNSGEPDINKIVNIIETDPSLSADLLRFVNSSKYILNRKISAIKEAVNLVGVNGIKYLLYSFGAVKTLNNRFGKITEIWNHSYKTARITDNLAKIANLKSNKDSYYTAGLLHAIGKIILMSFDENKTKRLEYICSKKGIDLSVIEEVMVGINYAKIGGKIAEHWGLPAQLVEPILHHADPITANQYKDIVFLVHLANYFAKINDPNFITSYAIEPEVKDYLNINKEDDFVKMYREAVSM